MNNFSISQLEQFSGIKAHTIRIWEQRYNALKPNRSEGNTRYYDNSQLKRLLNIVSLLNADYKVSEVCVMEDDKLFKLNNLHLKNSVNDDSVTGAFVNQFISSTMAYDETSLDKLFINCVDRFGLKSTYTKVIHPLLNRIGLLWLNNSIPPEQEHFVSNFIRKKIFSAIDNLPSSKSAKNSWLLFLPEDEFHEIGLLFSYYIIKAAGKKVTYLGSSVPLNTLKKAVEEVNPNNLLFFFIHNDIPANNQHYFKELIKNFKNKKLHVAGNHELLGKLKTGKEISWIRSVDELDSLVKVENK